MRRSTRRAHGERKARSVRQCHEHRALAPLGFSNASAPFLAGAKLPSRNDSLQSSLPFWSSSQRNCRHTLSQVSSSSQRRSLRQQVLGLGYSGGKSRQRAPVLRIHRMPSRTRRLSAHGRPLLERVGSSGSIFAHCLSERNGLTGFRTRSFSHSPPKKAPKNQKISREGLMKPLLNHIVDILGYV